MFTLAPPLYVGKLHEAGRGKLIMGILINCLFQLVVNDALDGPLRSLVKGMLTKAISSLQRHSAKTKT